MRYRLLLSILFVLSFFYGIASINPYFSPMTGFFVGELSVGVRVVNTYYNDSLTIVNQTLISTISNTTVQFFSNGTFNGYFNLTMDATNSFNVNVSGNLSLPRFYSITTNLNITSVTLNITYRDEEIIGINETTLVLYRYNTTISTWMPVPSVPDSATNTLTATLTSFSSFAIFGSPLSNASTETSSTPSSSGGSSGGGSGGGAARAEVITPDQDIVEFQLYQGETTRQYLTLSFTGAGITQASIEAVGLSDMLSLSQNTLAFVPEEEVIVELVVSASPDKEPGIYPGKVLVRTASSLVTIPVLVEVRSRESLFDAKVTIPAAYKLVAAGKTLPFLVELVNVGLGDKPVDVEMVVLIRDFNNRVLSEAHETFAVTGEFSKYFNIHLSPDMQLDKYFLEIRVTYPPNIVVRSYDTFTVVEESYLESIRRRMVLTIIFAALGGLLTLFGIIFFAVSYFKGRRQQR